MSPFDQIKRHLKKIKIDDALVFLNYLLHARNDPKINPKIHEFSKKHPGAITDFKIDFFSKWLIICSEFTSNVILSPKVLDWPAYLKLSELYNQINDPFVTDQKLKKEEPLNLIIRMFYQQLSGQQRIKLQSYGSASLLYEKAGSRSNYDIPNEFQSITELSIKEFMQLGMVLSSAKAGPYKTAGTLNQTWIDKGINVGIDALDKDKVQRFLHVASCDYGKFRITADQARFKVSDNKFILYEFNPLMKYPFIKIHSERWISPNPDLIVDRVTSGIYYDLLDVSGKSFTDHFGPIFEKYVGDLLLSVFPKEKVIKEQQYGSKRNRKKGPSDWTILDNSCAILIECKSFEPSLSMKTLASEVDIENYTRRIADAVEQVYKHINEIKSGHIDLKQFMSDEYKIIVLTLGRLQAVNTIFFKPSIIDRLEKKGISKPSFVVLSLQEFENYLSLVERGISFLELIERIETLGRNEALDPYMEMLRQNAVPKIVEQRGKEVLDVV
ncbi:MAG: hypothetical protein SRB1_02811 [Desulfobacteraceae bacterium Eth-SRB1]|nr:MAG: hypothetical protein SRB1_02811 [Desulfobacteraceae bacterium Eth-SRB1]